MVYYPDDRALLEALSGGRIDAIAKGEIGNRADAHGAGGDLVVTALDSRAELGGLALAAAEAALAACLDRQRRLADRRRAHRLPGVAG